MTNRERKQQDEVDGQIHGEDSSKSFAEKLGYFLAQAASSSELAWVDQLPTSLRRVVNEYDADPVKMALRAGCTNTLSVEALCKAMRARGMYKGVTREQAVGLANRLGIPRGAPVSDATRKQALRDEMTVLDDIIEASAKLKQPEQNAVLESVLRRMQFLRDDAVGFSQSSLERQTTA